MSYNFLLLDFTSPWHLILIGLVVLILFGGKKVKDFMGGLGEGVKAFKKGMKDDEPEPKKEDNSAPKPDATDKKEIKS